ncbi:MAG: acyloxyacyl hydrolase [Thermodesulfobacteriota bacterium]
MRGFRWLPVAFGIFLLCLMAGEAVFADQAVSSDTAAAETDLKKKWAGAFGSFGKHHHIWSASDYKGYENKAFGVFMEWETGQWLPLPVDTERTLRVDLRYSRLSGTIEITEDQVPPEKRTGGPYYTTLDQYLVSLMAVRRWIFLPEYWIRPTLHLGFGISLLNETILEDGTLHNFNFSGGGGLEADITKQWSAFLDCSWEHFSNGGQIYLTNSACIGPESINGVFGVRYRFR